MSSEILTRQETFMSESLTAPSRPLPRWLAFLAASAIALHLSAMVLLVLSASSGPWPTPDGPSPAMGPPFALEAGNIVTNRYLAPLKLTHNYHFLRNRPGQPEVYFEAHLKDESGQVTQTLRFPDPKANFWVRHRQSILAQQLADDQPVQTRGSEAIPAPNHAVRTIDIWDMNPDQTLTLRSVPEHLVARDRIVYRPSVWSVILARSYGRHLCRVHGAASVELVRHTREPLAPAILFVQEPPADVFQELISDFGEIKK
jgi:hypothetical protein